MGEPQLGREERDTMSVTGAMSEADAARAQRQNPDRQQRAEVTTGFARRVLIAALIFAAVIIVLLLLWYAVDVLMLVFAGILLAVFLRGVSDWLSARARLGANWSLAVVTLALIAALGVSIWLIAPRVSAQVNVLNEQLPRAVAQLTARLEHYEWARRILAQVPSPGELVQGRGGVLARATGIFSSALGALANVAIIVSIGLYLAAAPRLYVNGLVRLVPLHRRLRACEVLEQIGDTLRRWLIGRAFLMLLNGVVTALALWWLGVPLALTLGLLSALLNFVPNIGPIIAGVPAVLLALLQSPQQALYVLLLYVIYQSIDGYILTPLVQQRTIALPPVLTITAQVLLGVLLGGFGVVLATPLVAVGFVLVCELYVKDMLGDALINGALKINEEASE